MTKELVLTKGLVALVDDEDFVLLSAFRWSAQKQHNGTFYAVRGRRVGGRCETIRMHRSIINAPSNVQVDHINGDGLDNRKANLRMATSQENNRNRTKAPRGSSTFKGVSMRESGRWSARITVNGNGIYLGTFDSEKDAAHAYNEKARELFAEFAKLNVM